MMSAQQIFLGRGGGGAKVPTASDYVQTGLVAMWDGIENAGWGVHDANATVCIDLVGGVLSIDGAAQPTAFVTSNTGKKILNNIDTSADMTIEWLWRDAGTERNCQVYTLTSNNALRYQVNDISSSYATYQIRYWNGTSQVSKYPMQKTIRGGAITYSNGVFSVYGDGVIKASYNDAVASDSIRTGISKNTAFNSLRFYSRALTAAEIAANYAVDKARFNLP